MSRTLIASFASGVLGAVIGASVVAWRVSPDEVPPAAEKPASADVRAPERADADLERRIAAVERMVTLLETRTRARGTTPEPSVAAPASSTPHPVDTPVFEAAVMDIMERAEEGRAEEKAAARDEKRRQKARHWANELTLQLGLSPAQTEELLEIQGDLEDELERERRRGNAPDAPYASKEQRRAARDAARRAAEGKLRALLSPPQLATYEGLDDRLKLDRSKDD